MLPECVTKCEGFHCFFTVHSKEFTFSTRYKIITICGVRDSRSACSPLRGISARVGMVHNPGSFISLKKFDEVRKARRCACVGCGRFAFLKRHGKMLAALCAYFCYQQRKRGPHRARSAYKGAR